MSNVDLELLPIEIAKRSISEKEIVLPLQDALSAVDIIESRGILILGWEGWVKTPDGRVGHGPQGTVSLEDLSFQEATKVCRETITEEAALWEERNTDKNEALYFCITIDS